jgi:hypothetical protein
MKNLCLLNSINEVPVFVMKSSDDSADAGGRGMRFQLVGKYGNRGEKSLVLRSARLGGAKSSHAGY